MTTIDALRQVQEALEFIVDCNGIAVLDPIGSKELLDNVRLAIEQAEKQEPVAYLYEFFADRGHPGLAFEPQRSADNTPLYAAPPQRQPLWKEAENRCPYPEANPRTRNAWLDGWGAAERAHGIGGEE